MVEIPVIPTDFGPWCEAEGIHTVVAGAGDVHGIWRGKRLPPAEFLARLDRGIPFSDVVLVLTHSEDTDEGQELVEPPIAIAACLAGGLYGIEQKLPLPPAYAGDAYATGQLEPVPWSLEQALDLLESSDVAREMLGADFVQHYAAMKRFEAGKYRQQVSEWEVRRYAEMA
jgi:Glutamine synthetase, catalytic domain